MKAASAKAKARLAWKLQANLRSNLNSLTPNEQKTDLASRLRDIASSVILHLRSAACIVRAAVGAHNASLGTRRITTATSR